MKKSRVFIVNFLFFVVREKQIFIVKGVLGVVVNRGEGGEPPRLRARAQRYADR